MIERTVVSQRLDRAQTLLRERGVDLLLITPSSNLVYLLRYPAHASERPTLLAVPSAHDPFIILPQLEAPRMMDQEGVFVVTYGETESPYALLRSSLQAKESVTRAAISDEAWAVVLIELQRAFPDTSFEPANPLLRELRMRKQDDELALLERAGGLVDRAFDEMATHRFVGRSERQIAKELTRILTDLGLDTATWGPNVGSGPASASPHHLTGDRTVQEGDAVMLDFGGVVGGYQADISRTVHAGPPGEEFRRVYEMVRQAQQAAVEAVRPGTAAQEIDRVARDVISAGGYGDFFIHRTGHGIGLDTHEEPYIVEGDTLALEPGMTFSVEPGVYLPGKFGVRIEDIVAVTADGGTRFNYARRDLVIVS